MDVYKTTEKALPCILSQRRVVKAGEIYRQILQGEGSERLPEHTSKPGGREPRVVVKDE